MVFQSYRLQWWHDQATCPTGWSQVNETRGRVLVGQGSGNLDSAGNSLTTRTMASVGGLEYTNGIPAAECRSDDQYPGSR